MKKAVVTILCIILAVGIVAGLPILCGNNPEKIEKVFSDTIKSLDNGEKGLKELFTEQAVNESEPGNIDEGIRELSEFYKGKSVKVEDLEIFHETQNIYRAYATVTTDEDEYFLCVSITGARLIDPVGINQFIIEKNKNFQKKHILEKKALKKYEGKADEYGITIRRHNDHR